MRPAARRRKGRCGRCRRTAALVAGAVLLAGAADAGPADAGPRGSGPESGAREPAAAGPVPRELLFAEAQRRQVRISPDGRWLSWLAPTPAGGTALWLRPREGGEARPLPGDPERPVLHHAWAADGRHLLFLRPAAEDGVHLYALDLTASPEGEAGAVRDLTPVEGARAGPPTISPRRPHQVLVPVAARHPQLADVWRVDLAEGEAAPDTENPGDVVGWVADAALRVRAAVAVDPRQGSRTLRVRGAGEERNDQGNGDAGREERDAAEASEAGGDPEPGAWRDQVTWPFGERGGVVGFSGDGERLWVETSLGSDTTRLVALDVRTGEELATLADDPRCDLERVLVHPDTAAVQAAAFACLEPEWRVLDAELRPDLEALAEVERGHPWITARSGDDRFWVVAFERVGAPAVYHVWDRQAKRAQRLFSARPGLEGRALGRCEPRLLRARDGRPLPSYLTLPPAGPPGGDAAAAGADADTAQPAPADGPHPLVVLVHDGPWERDRFGWDARAQWLATRGWAVLQVNYRGSSGFGRRFARAGDGEWGRGAAQADLADAAAWAVEAGIADPDRLCLMGEGYGGYAVLAGLAFQPERWACGVAISAPADLAALVESIPDGHAPLRRRLLQRTGPVDEDEELNRRLSPLFHAGAIRAPLLVARRDPDPRVPAEPLERLVEALRAADAPVESVTFPDPASLRPPIEAFLDRARGDVLYKRSRGTDLDRPEAKELP